MPIPAAIASPNAASVNGPSGAGTAAPEARRAGRYTMATPAATNIQPRATHASLGPAATTSANAAVAYRPHAA